MSLIMMTTQKTQNFYAVAALCLPTIRRSEIDEMIDKVIHAVSLWDALAKEYSVPTPLRKSISQLLLVKDFI